MRGGGAIASTPPTVALSRAQPNGGQSFWNLLTIAVENNTTISNRMTMINGVMKLYDNGIYRREGLPSVEPSRLSYLEIIATKLKIGSLSDKIECGSYATRNSDQFNERERERTNHRRGGYRRI